MKKTTRISILLVAALCLYGCSSEQPVEHHGDIAALQRTVQKPDTHLGKIQQVTTEPTMKEPTHSTTITLGEDISIDVPSRYTVEQVSWNNGTKCVLYSAQDNDTIDLYSGALQTEVSSNEVADSMTDWFIDTYYPDGQPKSVGASTRSGTTIQNIIKFTDGTNLTYFCIGTSVIVLHHTEECPLISTLTTSILSKSDKQPEGEETQSLPTQYTALQGAHYYSMKNIATVSGQAVYIVFPLTTERTTLQVYNNASELVYDTYLQQNSMYYANSLKLKLDPSYILYTSKSLAIAKEQNNVSDNQSTGE